MSPSTSEQRTATATGSRPSPTASSRRPRILVIDDSLTIRKFVQGVLGRRGYQVEVASTGKEGIDTARRLLPNLILLDYVLPDMKGHAVCDALQHDDQAGRIPIIVMSAKGEEIREQFTGYAAVVESVGKPLGPQQLDHVVSTALARHGGGDQAAQTPAPSAPPASERGQPAAVFTYEQKEMAARLIYERLRGRLAQIPRWVPHLGNESPALFFGRLLLTPDVLEGILTPLAAFVHGGNAGNGTPKQSDRALWRGQLAFLALRRLLDILASTQQTGVLTIEQDERTSCVYLRRGTVILCTHNQPEDYLQGAGVELASADADALAAAEAEQRQSGRPAFVTLAAAGELDASLLGDLLHRQGIRALVEIMESGVGSFAWHDSPLPEFAESYGRPYSLDQAELERLRNVDDFSQVELEVDALDAVFARSDGFSSRLSDLSLTDLERRVLTLVNGRLSVQDIIQRTGQAMFEICRVLFCLRKIGLVERRDAPAAPLRPRTSLRPVLIVDAQHGEYLPHLQALLRRHDDPPVLVRPEQNIDDLMQMLREMRPRLVLLGGASSMDLRRLAERVRETLETSDLVLAALLDWPDLDEAPVLLKAGFDNVLVKPFAAQALVDLLTD